MLDVTILMPCLNEVLTMEHCVKNAHEAGALLEEQGFSYEVLISDNDSDDGSQELAEKLGARVVSCPDRGYGNAVEKSLYWESCFKWHNESLV